MTTNPKAGFKTQGSYTQVLMIISLLSLCGVCMTWVVRRNQTDNAVRTRKDSQDLLLSTRGDFVLPL